MKIIVTIIPTDLVANSLLSFFCPFLQTKNKNHVFSKFVICYQEIFVFCLQRVALYFKAMLNSIEFYKGIFLHTISVCILSSMGTWRLDIVQKFS